MFYERGVGDYLSSLTSKSKEVLFGNLKYKTMIVYVIFGSRKLWLYYELNNKFINSNVYLFTQCFFLLYEIHFEFDNVHKSSVFTLNQLLEIECLVVNNGPVFEPYFFSIHSIQSIAITSR